MLPPHLPFRSKVVSVIGVTRGPVRSPPTVIISGKSRPDAPARCVRGHRIELKRTLRVNSTTLAVLGPRD